MDQPVAIITGAGRGIGRATAIELARLEHRVVLIARNETELHETAQLAGNGLVIPADVTDPAHIDRIVSQTLAKFGRIDVIANVAGVAPLISVADMSIDQWRATIDTNLSAVFYLSRAVWPRFAKQKSGVIVSVSSMSSRDPFLGFAAYGAAKAGVNLFSLALAREGAPIGVRVHVVAPGAVETGMFRTLMTPEQFPTEKTLDPAEVARVIGQCVAGELRYTSGEVIYLHKTM